MDDPKRIPGRKHGRTQAPIACRHIVRAIDRMWERKIGFHRDPSDAKPFPDAWCTRCDKVLAKAGGEWSGAALEHAGFSEVCPCCYELQRLSEEPDAFALSAIRGGLA